MALSCTNPHCYPEDNECQEGYHVLRECPSLVRSTQAAEVGQAEPLTELNLDGRRVNWTGRAMGVTDLEPLTARSRLLLIGLAGMENAGKTTFLALLYSLLRRGQPIPGYRFTGSYTLSGWEFIAGFLTFQDGSNQVSFPPHTSRNAGRVPGLLHLALKDEAGDLLDVAFTDAPGEWFDEWRNNQRADGALGAEWIYQKGDGFLLFADCEELAGSNRGNARMQVQMLTDRLVANLGTRPLGLVWAKSDFETVRPTIREKIQGYIQATDPQRYQEFAVSVKQDDEQFWHKQVLETIAWLLNIIRQEPGKPPPSIPLAETDDLFLLRRKVTS